MTSFTRRGRRFAAAFTALLILATAAAPAQAAGYEPITGSGSTWSQNALDQWRTNVEQNYGMTVNYNGVGSTQGRREYINGDLDFAISEIPFQARPEDGSAPEAPPIGFAYMPIVAGGTSFMYNLNIGGKRVTNLRLSGAVITKIFTGAITKWNDPAVQADNPGLAMPDKAIVPIVRSDGSGTSAQFSLWMSKQHPDLWTSGMRSQFPTPPNGKAQKGSDGVSGYVAQNYGEGAITYVEYSYAIEQGFPVAKVLNAADYYVEPTADSVAVALLQAQINNNVGSSDYLTQILDGVYNNADPRTYPLSSYSYMIVPTALGGKTFTEAKGATLGTFASYMLCEGQQQAEDLGYSPLPMNLVLAGFEQIKRIPGAGGSNVDPNSCNNPTFQPGDSPNNNRLALTAPQPADCDKRGPNQCTTGTAGATGETPVTGSGSGGAASNAAGAGGAGTAAGPDAAAASGGEGAAVYDAEGNLISGDGAVAGSAVSLPFTLDDGLSEWQRAVMIGAVVLLIAAIAVPPFLSPRLRKKAGGR
ncbi:phosphate transport system substrate-binding protein [Microbacterium trichothecenolyticum]|uniref:phosphate ABC transporter substrate-binding protein PstS n=1 Tax=Microbacterium trichothecenolyticum TaxID=69370 RepID=UPI002862B5C0|nr:phosphate ABC transporter substrate-binding protein PstS [Microbacterium trichothecenolyticum]MDR7182988.1 phosphate transport system substrate-binding protein [Microbacterium trichothecenolyticum]